MRKARTRVGSLLLAVIMLLTIIPTTALAVEGDVAQVDDETYATLQEAIDAAVDGDTVELLKTGTQAEVVGVNKDGTLQLQAGILKLKAKQDEVRVVEGETQSQKEARRIVQRAQHTLRAAAAPSEIDLRGMMTDEAIAVLDRFLDTAMMGKLESVTIIHGKGTGAVRKAVREHLKRSRYIKSFRPGRYGEGEDGVTVVELK